MAKGKPSVKKTKMLPSETVVLTPELKEQVNARITECIKMAKELWDVDVTFPIVRYDIKTHMGGLCYQTKHLIRLNPILVENVTDYIQETVAHEIAHLIVPYVFKKPKEGRAKILSHGPEWQEIMVGLKIGPKPGQTWKDVNKHKYDTSSIELPPRKKHGPRKPGGRKVGEILLKIGTLNEEEMAALVERLGVPINIVKVAEPVITPEDIIAVRESNQLRELLYNVFADIAPEKGTLAGWAICAIKDLKEKV